MLGLLFQIHQLKGQEVRFPADGARLSQTQILFQWQPGTGQSWLEISKDSAFQKAVFTFPRVGNGSVLVREGLTLGHTYFWRLIHYQGPLPTDTSAVFSFHLLRPSSADTARYRHRVLTDALPRGTQGLVAVDKPGIFLNLRGETVWAHPDTLIGRLFDLRLLPTGDIAYLRPKNRFEGNENLAFEVISPDGALIWRAPDRGEVSGDTAEYYHHAWQRLANGHFVLAGNQFVYRNPPKATGPVYCKLGTLIEYNPEGEVVWQWRLADHISDEALFEKGFADNPAHLNGFFVDETEDKVYVSLRYLDQVWEVKKSTGAVLRVFGGNGQSALAGGGAGAFHRQHSPSRVGDALLLFDNGLGKWEDSVSQIRLFNLPAGKGDSISLRWTFPLYFGDRRISFSESKGDVDRIGEGLYLATMGSTPRTALIDSVSGMVWVISHEMKMHPEGDWQGITDNYRADWAPDLYPLRWEAVITPAGPAGGWNLRIQNLGWQPDGFTIEWPAKKKKNRFWQIPTLVQGEVRDITLPEGSPAGKVFIRSVTNPRLHQVLTLP